MRGKEYISAEGYREDGRHVDQLRTVYLRMGGNYNSDGFAYIQIGNTKAIAYVNGPKQNKRYKETNINNKGTISCTYTIAAFATHDRNKRHTRDKLSIEMALTLRLTFEAAIPLEMYPRSNIDISVHILETDGGERSIAFNVVSLALADAGVPMNNIIVSCSCSIINDNILLDPTHTELLASSTNLILACEAASCDTHTHTHTQQ
eukprot:GHVR01166683.1.p1 GENE.GHVR01166683.1~~GHVR01166683.1.p1  ORF type:complete len:216 (+),score=74.80 GHVR01166683.1:34-648(+)